ncbi:MAG: replicative DNA helicase [Parasphingorhabdus sp.]|nr:replicative DNA helicase [Parasphingorhabdus sp.]
MAELIKFAPDNDAGNDSGNESASRLPCNIEAEATFLGALMIDNRVAEDVQIKLRPDHFFEPLHGRIYEQALKLLDRRMIVTPVTLKPYFENDEAMKSLGGPAYLAKLTGDGAGLIGARDFAEQIYELALLRELVAVGRELVENALDTSESVDPKGQIEAAETALYRVAEGEGEGGSVKSFLAASTEAIANAQRAFDSGGHISGITTGLTDLNAKIGGLHNSDLLILAGRPGMGKTSLATNIAFNAAQRWLRDQGDGIEPEKSVGAKVAFFSLEMSADQLATRVLSEAAEISSEKLRMGKISREEMHKLALASRELQDLPLFIDDTPALTIAALRTRARRLKRRHDIGLVVVDYLQLLQGTGRANDNRVNEISEISRGLKTLAKELGVPVLALSQLSRAVESREDKRPQLSDLRESGSIEQDADIVMFIYRDEYYHLAVKPDDPTEQSTEEQIAKYQKWETDHQSKVGKATVMVSKQRHGATGNVQLAFQSEFTKFGDLAWRDEPEGY